MVKRSTRLTAKHRQAISAGMKDYWKRKSRQAGWLARQAKNRIGHALPKPVRKGLAALHYYGASKHADSVGKPKLAAKYRSRSKRALHHGAPRSNNTAIHPWRKVRGVS